MTTPTPSGSPSTPPPQAAQMPPRAPSATPPPVTPPPATSAPVTTPSAKDQSLGELFGQVTEDLSTLMRQEVDLAKAEVQQSARRAGKGAGLLGGAAWAANFVLLFLSLALWWALGAMLGEGDEEPALGWAALIVAVIWAVVAAVMALVGKKSLDSVEGVPRTVDSVEKIPEALKGHQS